MKTRVEGIWKSVPIILSIGVVLAVVSRLVPAQPPPETTDTPTQTQAALSATPETLTPEATSPPLETATPTQPAIGLPVPKDGLTAGTLDSLEPITPDNAARLTQVGLIGAREDFGSAWSPDGKWLAGATSDGVYFDAVGTFEPAGYLKTGAAQAVAFSPIDNSLLAVESESGRVALWDITTGSETRALGQYSAWTSASFGDNLRPTFSPDGKWLAAVVRENNQPPNLVGERVVPVWEVSTGNLVRVFHGWVAQFAPDGALAVYESENKKIQLWDVASGEALHAFVPSKVEYGLDDMAFTPDGKRLATVWGTFGHGAYNSTTFIWNVDTGAEEYRVNGQGHGSLAFSPDGRLMASGEFLFDTATDQLVRKLNFNKWQTYSEAFSPDGKWLAIDGAVWEVDSGKAVERVQPPSPLPGLHHVVFPLGGQSDLLIILPFGTQRVIMLNVVTGETLDTLDLAQHVAESAESSEIVLSPTGALRAVASTDLFGQRAFTVYLTANGQPVAQMRRPYYADAIDDWQQPIFSPDNSLRAVAGTDESGNYVVTLWSVASGLQLSALPQRLPAEKFSFAAGGKLLVVDNAFQLYLWGVPRP